MYPIFSCQTYFPKLEARENLLSESSKYNKKKAIYPIMDTLSREFALSRTSFTLFAIISIMSLFRGNCCASLLFALISLIYLFSWSKQASKIVLLMADEDDNGINEKKVD